MKTGGGSADFQKLCDAFAFARLLNSNKSYGALPDWELEYPDTVIGRSQPVVEVANP